MDPRHPPRGPLAGEPLPIHGGAPGDAGCNGCADCCHLLEISVTAEEAARLSALYAALPAPPGPLELDPDPARPGWMSMRGPCPFLRQGTGRCGVYDDRPSMCRIFTCAFLLERRRRL
jgi:Fe-S-cluster containining protein